VSNRRQLPRPFEECPGAQSAEPMVQRCRDTSGRMSRRPSHRVAGVMPQRVWCREMTTPVLVWTPWRRRVVEISSSSRVLGSGSQAPPLQERPEPSRAVSAHRIPIFVVAGLLLGLASVPACVRGQPASDTSDPGFPFGPTPGATGPLAYVQDIKPIFDRDCFQCHSSFNQRGSYSVGTYADTIAGQRPGDAHSSVVVDCSPGGSMYRYFSGNAVAEATMVFRWMVVYNAAETR
jgi:hypothetical protein